MRHSSREDGWQLREGEPITAELAAVRLLGGGAAYEAWLAFDEVTWSPVVVKMLRPSQVDDESSRRGMRREVTALTQINHPVVVRALRAELDTERPHLVLEHVDGPRLSTLIRRYGALQAQQYLPLVLDVAAALHYFRRVGWTHLDIKPSNVIMGAPARLIDLSVARPEDEARRLAYPIGTDAYMSPEQCDPGARGGPSCASDVWGLGATLFHAVTGRRPFRDGEREAAAPEERFPQLAARETPLAQDLPRDLPGEVVEMIEACLDEDPHGRPLPHEISDSLSPVLARLPRGSLAGFKIR